MLTTLLPNTRRVAVVGDLHGNYRYMRKALNYAFGHKSETDDLSNADVVVQVGDFGYWGNFVDQVEQLLTEQHPGKYVLFADGNHEHHTRLDAQPVDEDGVRRLTEHVWHLPRGLTWQWGDQICLAAGGAISVDRSFREPGYDWFPRERMSGEEWLRCVQAGKVDIVFAHDAPGGYTIPDLPPPSTFPANAIADAEYYRNTTMDSIGQATQPERWFHGHYHVAYEDMIFWEDGSPCTVTGLNCDGNPLPRVVQFFDI